MIHLELQPEIEAQLAAEAAARGLPVELLLEDYVTERLAGAALNRGLEEIAAGCTRPAREVFAEFREKHGIRG